MPAIPFSPLRFRIYAQDLSKAVLELSRNQEYRMSNPTVLNMALLPKTSPISEKSPSMTIAEQLKAARAAMADARQGAASAVVEAADAARVATGEVAKVLKEASDLRAEVAELTNGGPE